MNDLFLIILESNICNFADDNTLSSCDLSCYVVKYTFKADTLRAIEWFNFNSLVIQIQIRKKIQMLILGTPIKNDLLEFANLKLLPQVRSKY